MRPSFEPSFDRKATILPFRRRRFVERHRKKSRWAMLLKPLAGALLVVGLPVAGGTWMLTSKEFSLETIEVAPLERVERGWLDERLEPYRHRHLLDLRLGELEAELADHPWIAGVEMTKFLPDRLTVRVLERQPAGILRRSEGLFFVDASGTVVAPYSSEAGPADLPLILATQEREAYLANALEVMSRLAEVRPDWHGGLSEVEVLGRHDFALITDRLPFPVRVSSDRLEQGIRELEQYLPEILRRYSGFGTVDLRFARQIVIQPAAQRVIEKG